MRDLEQLADLRLSYQKGSLDVQDVDACPFAQFAVWLEYALSTDLPEPYAMTLATCGTDSRPSARTVYMTKRWHCCPLPTGARKSPV